MKLDKKKALAAKVFGVGKNRIAFAEDRLDEIKEAITKQDIKDLNKSGAIMIKEIKGRRKTQKRKTRKGEGKIKKRAKKRKQQYVKITRKLRRYAKELKNAQRIRKEDYNDIRKKIKSGFFKSKSQLKEFIEGE